MTLGYRVCRTGQSTTPYALERLDAKGDVTSVRPASAEEFQLYCLVLRQLP